MFRFGVFVVLWSLMTYAFGFAANRSAFLPAVWNKAPSLDAYQRVFLDPGTSRTQVTGADKISPDARLSTKLTEKMSDGQTRERRSTAENIGVELVGDITSFSTMKNEAFDPAFIVAAPRNVILLLIEKDQTGTKEEDLWWNYRERLPFAIKGSFECCSDKIETNEPLFLNVAMINGSKDKDCDCERILRSNIGELLHWAKYARGMTTASVSSSNFTIPLRYERSNENDANTVSRKNRRESEIWQVIDLGDRAKSIPTTIIADPNIEGASEHYEGAWNVFDVFSKIRMAFFRSLLETLGRNDGAFESEFSPRRLYHLKPTVTNFIESTMREIKSASNDYVLVAVVPRSERLIAIDLLRREISKDTLLIIVPLCIDKKSVSYIAQGPGNQILREAKTILRLPIAIRKAIAGDCRDSECANRQRRDAPIRIFSQELAAQKRNTRDKNAVEQLKKSSKLVNNREDTKHAEQTNIQIRARSSTSPKTMPRDLATVLGIATSIPVMAALTSSS